MELEQEEQKRLLRNADILGLLEGEETVTVGGMLLFGKDPQRRIPQSFITFAVFDGLLLTDELLDKQNIGRTLPELIQQTHAKASTFLPKPSTLSGMQRVEVPMIPDKVIREALVNAVCHRDYSMIIRSATEGLQCMCSVTGWKLVHPVACKILLTSKKFSRAILLQEISFS